MTPKDKARDARLRRYYGISLADYNRMLRNQRHRCYICERPVSTFKKSLSVDHSHITGIVRGLLCPFCNRGLRYFSDDARRLRRAAKHVERNHGFIVPDQYLKGQKRRRKRKKK